MPALTGNLTEVTVVDADLQARVPTILSYIPQGESDWSAQITAGRTDAEEAFRVGRRELPARAAALADEDWRAIVVCFALSVIYRGSFNVAGRDEFIAEADAWRQEGLDRLGRFVYDYDADEGGTIDSSEELAQSSGRDIEILAG